MACDSNDSDIPLLPTDMVETNAGCGPINFFERTTTLSSCEATNVNVLTLRFGLARHIAAVSPKRNKTSYKTDAYYGNPLTGFTAAP